jgi:hypothetical protein
MTPKKKICKSCQTEQFIWARGMCKRCDALNKPLQQKKMYKPIPKISDKQAKRMRAYNAIATQFKRYHPICQARVKCSGALTTEVHHMRGRLGDLLFDSAHFLAVCSECHRFITDNSEQAFALGLSESRLAS